MEEIRPWDTDSTLDDAIVMLHIKGETIHQAIGRVSKLPWVEPHSPALVTEVPQGRVPLANTRAAPLPRLDAKGVAAILTFELDVATYEAEMSIVTKPRPPRKPRVESRRLWPALRASGYRAGPTLGPITPGFTPRRVLADRAGLGLRSIDRICSGATASISDETAIAILEELGAPAPLPELEAHLARWEQAMHLHHYDRFEYLEKLRSLTGHLVQSNLLTTTELAAIRDLHLYLIEAHREPSSEEHVLSAEERLTAADNRFAETHGRRPTPISPRLTRYASSVFARERRALRDRERALHKGLQGGEISTKAVYARTNRLRRAERLPARSKPRAFQPPADYDDIFGYHDRENRRTATR